MYQHYGQPETVWGRGRQSIYTLLPAQLRLGYRFSDGIALELGGQYRFRRPPLTLQRTYNSAPGHFYWQTRREVFTLAFPLTVSAPLAPRRLASTPWRLEARVGLALLLSRSRFRQYTATTTSPVPYEMYPGEQEDRLGDVPAVVGARVGYALGRRLELTADGSASFSMLVALSALFGPETSPFGGGGSLGLRYNF